MALRLYYKNTFFHIGHIGAIFENERRALERKVPCYVYVDDRVPGSTVSDVKQYIRYLNLTQHRVVSLRAYDGMLRTALVSAAEKGNVTLHCNATNDHVNSKHDPTLVQHILANPESFTYCVFVKGNYAGRMDIGRGLELTYSFILDTLDRHFHVDALDSNMMYTIRSFCYTKRHWELETAAHPHLLTLRGLELRHFPAAVLAQFNAEAVVSNGVQISRLRELALDHLKQHAVPLRAAIKPAELTLTDIRSCETRYSCTSDKVYVPLSRRVYVDGTVLGMDRSQHALTVGTTVSLSGHDDKAYRCVDLCLEPDELRVTLAAKPCLKPTDGSVVLVKNWVAYDFSTRAVFHLYNWFYTGYNRFCQADICEGVVDHSAFTKLNEYVYLADYGYFAYDEALTNESGTLTYIQVLGYQEPCVENGDGPLSVTGLPVALSC